MKKLLVVLSLAALAGATYAKADNIQTLPSYQGYDFSMIRGRISRPQ